MFWKEFFKYVDKYKTYLLLAVIIIILVIIFTPSSSKFLTRKEVKVILKENKALMKQYQKNLDSIEIYKKLYADEKNKADSSKTITKVIKIKTDEDVNRIPTLSFDSNVALFTRDLEQYLLNR
jgi:hypothetical protein